MLARDAIIVAATSSPNDSPHSSKAEHTALAIKADRIPRTDSSNEDRNVHPDDSLRVEPTDATTRASMTAVMPVEGQRTLSPSLGSAGQCTGAFPLHGCDIREVCKAEAPSRCNSRGYGMPGCRIGERWEGIVSLVASPADVRSQSTPYPPPPPTRRPCINMTTQLR